MYYRRGQLDSARLTMGTINDVLLEDAISEGIPFDFSPGPAANKVRAAADPPATRTNTPAAHGSLIVHLA